MITMMIAIQIIIADLMRETKTMRTLTAARYASERSVVFVVYQKSLLEAALATFMEVLFEEEAAKKSREDRD
jgi:hypothetical protein